MLEEDCTLAIVKRRSWKKDKPSLEVSRIIKRGADRKQHQNRANQAKLKKYLNWKIISRGSTKIEASWNRTTCKIDQSL